MRRPGPPEARQLFFNASLVVLAISLVLLAVVSLFS